VWTFTSAVFTNPLLVYTSHIQVQRLRWIELQTARECIQSLLCMLCLGPASLQTSTYTLSNNFNSAWLNNKGPINILYYLKANFVNLSWALAFFFKIKLFITCIFFPLYLVLFLFFSDDFINRNKEKVLYISLEFCLFLQEWLLNHLKEIAIFQLHWLNWKCSPGAKRVFHFPLMFSSSSKCKLLECLDVILGNISPRTFAFRNIMHRSDLIFIFQEAINKRS
jgi:hypothetical protein